MLDVGTAYAQRGTEVEVKGGAGLTLFESKNEDFKEQKVDPKFQIKAFAGASLVVGGEASVTVTEDRCNVSFEKNITAAAGPVDISYTSTSIYQGHGQGQTISIDQTQSSFTLANVEIFAVIGLEYKIAYVMDINSGISINTTELAKQQMQKEMDNIKPKK